MYIRPIYVVITLLFLSVTATAQEAIDTVIPRWKPNKPNKPTISDLFQKPPKPSISGLVLESMLTYDCSTGEIVCGKYRYKMVEVEGGSFSMGATPEQDNPTDMEMPVHWVGLSNYYMGQTEVPQWLWKAVMGDNPSLFKGDNLPVEFVSWDDCQEFLWKLNQITGQEFRLPTEAQWEYAARGGSLSQEYQYSGSYAVGAVAWTGNNSGDRTHAVATKDENELGLYDMSGNVYEWCGDWFSEYSSDSVTNPTGLNRGTHRVIRGGDWMSGSGACRVAFRASLTPNSRNSALGLRLVMTSPKIIAVQPAEPKLTYNSSTQEIVYGEHRYKMVKVEGGSFTMGATPEQVDPYDWEKPVHRVTLSSYSIGQTEVPQWLWVAVMGSNPSAFKGDNLPVERVSWNDCQEFFGKLNNLTGMHFSLPTEAQWEFAARGGNRSRGYYQYSGGDGIGVVAWYEDNSNSGTHEVGLKGSNELGLYDMSGNVWEWCHDWYGKYPDYSVTNPKGASSGSGRVLRGGSCFHSPRICRVAFRNGSAPGDRINNLGFRLAL